MKVTALINPTAGGVGPDGWRRMREMLQGAGVADAEVVTFDPENATDQMRGLIARAADLFIVWGGDGTHRTALTVAGPEFDKLLLLPGGTMNLLTKWIHGQRTWDATLRAVIDGRTTRSLGAGSVDDQMFFCALLAGAPAKFAQAREDVRMGEFGRAMQDTSAAVDAAHHLQLTAETGANDRLPPGNIIAALVGPLARTRRMDVAALNLPSAVAALSFAWTSIRSDWRHLDEVVVRTADTLTIADPSGKPVPAIMDGEQVAIGSRFTVRYRKSAARCVVAAAP